MFAASVPEPIPLPLLPLADANGQHDNDSLTDTQPLTQPNTLAVTDCYDDADSGANSEPVPGSVGYAYSDSPSDEPTDASD
jgi:hypothetical protein